jgi:hypothetical protein
VPGPHRTRLYRDRMIEQQIARATLGRDPGPMTAVTSLSHEVHVGSDIVVKIIDAGGHSRLDREITLAAVLPPGLTAPLLGSGHWSGHGREIRYACYARMPGTAPGMGLPGADAATARSLAAQALRRLSLLHGWSPPDPAARTLREPLDHGGFVSQAALFADIEALTTTLPRRLLDGLTAIAEKAPPQARVVVPVHADCHWDNWLAADGRVTALLDFEWARFGEPIDDWFFVIAFSGPHLHSVLDVVARKTATDLDVLRAACEVRHAAFLASDIRLAHARPGPVPPWLTGRLRRLEDLIVDRLWWDPRVRPGRAKRW